MQQERLVQYLGHSGLTLPCLSAVDWIVGSPSPPARAQLVTVLDARGTNQHNHLFCFWDWGHMELTVVLSGFGSGYGGTGHKGLSRALCLLSLSRIPFVETWLEKREFKAVDQQRISPELFDHLRQKAYTEGPESPLLYGYVLQDHVDLLAAGEFLRALHTHLGHSPRLQTEWLDKEVQQRSGGTFHSDPETAVFNAFKVLETRLRSRTGATEGSGTDLVREAFHPESGALANPALPKAEREGVYLLFRGAFMALRNPRGHRFLDEEDTMANIESLMLADLMLRIVDAAPQTATQ